MHVANHCRTSKLLSPTGAFTFFGILAAALMLGVALICGQDSPGSAQASLVHPGGEVRIGTYDSRAVAVAYIRSEPFSQKMKELHRQRAEAVKAGDQKAIEQLEATGQSMQIRMNLQGFSTAPVDDVLDTVRDKLPGVAQQACVVVITRGADHHEAGVEVVDITDALVRLFDPDEQTLKVIAELRKQKPQPIEAVAKMPANP